ncbi:MAG: PilZ domain-containing protein [Archangium sp.]|nr:PilZ domain-containing protein [Archangium sp.]MDP3155166.1 PilZ domain-containing protein [Archangium sp.]MDP3572518.1 PilZ domain-containing protein [Archangium sp.]
MATSTRKNAATVQGRRYPRFHLDVDWFVVSKGCSTLGRGIELSVRGALLPATCNSPFTDEVTLYLSLPLRPKMLKAQCTASNQGQRGWVLHFEELSPEDLQLLGHTLLTEFGVAALPNLERRAEHAIELP